MKLIYKNKSVARKFTNNTNVIKLCESKHYQTLEISAMEKRQIQAVLRIAAESGLSFWSFEDFEKETESADGFIKAARIGSQTVGFIIARASFEKKSSGGRGEIIELEICNIAVKKQFRKKGIGRALLRQLLNHARPFERAVIWLEVRESNQAALDFYSAHNFKIAYRRKDFYSRPPEDALVMKLEISREREQL